MIYLIINLRIRENEIKCIRGGMKFYGIRWNFMLFDEV